MDIEHNRKKINITPNSTGASGTHSKFKQTRFFLVKATRSAYIYGTRKICVSTEKRMLTSVMQK